MQSTSKRLKTQYGKGHGKIQYENDTPTHLVASGKTTTISRKKNK